MTQKIEAIFLDLGNTLRILVKDQEHMARARQRIVELVGTDEDPATFVARLDERYKVYRKWAFENLREASKSEMWTRWLTPDFPPERIAPLSGELTYQFRQSMGRRVVVDGGREVVEELQQTRLYPWHYQQPDRYARDPRVAGSRKFRTVFQSGGAFLSARHPQAGPGDLYRSDTALPESILHTVRTSVTTSNGM